MATEFKTGISWQTSLDGGQTIVMVMDGKEVVIHPDAYQGLADMFNRAALEHKTQKGIVAKKLPDPLTITSINPNESKWVGTNG